MKRCSLVAGLLLGLVLGIQGCKAPVQAPLPRFQVDQQKLKPSPPVSALPAAPGHKPSEVVKDQVQIQPEKAVGYENLPTTITTLFDAPTVELSLPEVVTETLGNNLGIKIQGYTMRIAEYQVPVNKGIYDLLISSRLQYNRVEEQTSTAQFGSLGVNSSRARQGQISLSQLLPTGATVDFGYSDLRNSLQAFGLSSTFAPTSQKLVTYQNRSTASITQPLLQGFGPTVTNAQIRIAQLEQQGSAADFQARVVDQLSVSLQGYWELIGAIENFKVQVISYSAARDLLRINTAKFKAGVVPRTEVLQAEAAAEGRRVQIIQARQNVRDIEDRLKRQLFLQEGTPRWNVQIKPSQSIAWREFDVNLDEAIATAMELRPEMRRATSNVNQAEVNRKVARNQLLPALNLFGQVDANGLDGSNHEAFDTMGDSKYNNYTAGIEFSYPLQNRAARYGYKQADARHSQAEEMLRDEQNQITLDVRQAVRDLRTAREQITVTQSQVRSSQATLDAETKRLQVGISTSFEVLQFQQDLADAQSRHLRAVTDYNRAAVRLERSVGSLLPTYGVNVEGADLNPLAKPVLFPVGLN